MRSRDPRPAASEAAVLAGGARAGLAAKNGPLGVELGRASARRAVFSSIVGKGDELRAGPPLLLRLEHARIPGAALEHLRRLDGIEVDR